MALGVITEGAACELPLAWRLQVLEAQLKDRVGYEILFEEADLWGLVGAEREAAIDALAAGHELPFVLVADHVVATGQLDAEKIEVALGRLAPS
ncbi:MAG: hypothetical protein CVT67_02370 [Actinobacteria bacterium HGW-Actinobacteria-7]|nr:MAG: hypothetical protein CVT67_02370 [Actinobacteria bacterium HGW-Actinobacteria-7]